MKKSKRKIGIISFCVLLFLSGIIVLQRPQIVYAAEAIKIEKIARTSPAFYTRTVEKGKTTYLKVIIVPNDAENQDLKWSSSNSKIATVTQTGKVTGKKNGTVLVTASATDGSKKKITWKVTVGIPTTEIKTIEDRLQLKEGEELKVNAYVVPENATNKLIQFTSQNDEIAIVDQKGNVKGVSAGTTEIILRAKDGKSTSKIKVVVEAVSTERNLYIDSKNFKEYAVISDQTYDNITIDGSIGNQKIIFINVVINQNLTLMDGGTYTVDIIKSKIQNLVFTSIEKSKDISKTIEKVKKSKKGVYPSMSIAPAILIKDGTNIQQVQMRASAELYCLANSSISNLQIGNSKKNDAILAKLEGLECSMSIENETSVMIDVRSCRFDQVNVYGSATIADMIMGNGSSYIKKLQLTGVQAVWNMDLPIETVVVTSDSRGSTLSMKRTCTELTNNGLATYLMLISGSGGRINSIILSGTGGTITGDGSVLVDTIYVQNSNLVLNRKEIGNPKVLISSYANQVVVDGVIQRAGNVIPRG